MSLWYFTLFIVTMISVPCTFSRHLDHSESRSEITVNENVQRAEDEDSSSWLFPKSHLRLYTRPARVVQTREGESEMLECQAGGSPLPRIYWTRNGVQITKVDISDELEPKDDSGNPRLNIGSTSARLYLDCVTMEDDAEYSCVAENANHRESTTTRVRVASSAAADVECKDKEAYGEAPRILTWTKTALENQGEDIRVICRVQGEPKPTIKWLNPREHPIQNSSKYEISSNGDLVIRNLKWRDMGNYVCLAENIHGSARTEAFVYPATPET